MRRVLNLPSIWVPSINLAFGKPSYLLVLFESSLCLFESPLAQASDRYVSESLLPRDQSIRHWAGDKS